MSKFRRVPLSCANGTSLQGYVTLSYNDLVRVLGEPDPESGDQWKISTQWVVEHNGRVWTIYDWKCTNLYADGLPSVEEFRSLPFYSWHIGGENLGAFHSMMDDIQEEVYGD